jgi:hypothetical protein
MSRVKGLEFYSAAAQIIPVLVLVFVIEFRMSTVWPYLPRHLRVLAFFLLGFAALGEMRALHVLQSEHAWLLDPWIVWTALGGLALGIISGTTGNPFAPAKTLDQ